MLRPFAANSSCVAASRTWPMLPGRRLELQREDRLNRIDDDQGRLDAGDLVEDAFEAGLGEQVERRVADREPLAARLDLVLGFLARAVEHGPDRARHVRGRLQQQRRLADAGLAAEEHERPGHDAAAEHAIELADAGREPLVLLELDVRVQPRRAGGRGAGIPVRRGSPARGSARSSTNEFQAPQSAQRPSHFDDCEPHSWQTKTVFAASSSSSGRAWSGRADRRSGRTDDRAR